MATYLETLDQLGAIAGPNYRERFEEQFQPDHQSDLVKNIQKLEDDREWLLDRFGSLLATLSLERNREAIREGKPASLDELFRIIDKVAAENLERFPHQDGV